MTLGLIGEKLGMTQVYDDEGLVIPVTVIKVDPLTVTQVKTKENDGYNAVQVGYLACKKHKLNKPELKHLEKKNLPAFKKLKEFRVDENQKFEVGQAIDLSILKEGENVDVTGRSIGKGFQGTVKRYNAGRGPMSHGSKFHRSMGSIGAGTTPGRVYKGGMMPGNMGNENVTVRKLKVVKIIQDENILLVKGSVPGPEGKFVTVKPSITEWNKYNKRK